MADPKPLRVMTIVFTDGTRAHYQITEDDLTRLIDKLCAVNATTAWAPVQTLEGQPRTLLLFREHIRYIG